jgi:DNA-binding response OmpR family regulator
MEGKVFLVHWDKSEAEACAAALRAAGWKVDVEAEDGARAVKQILADPPDVVLIYLTRSPSHGRETAHALRSHKAGRDIRILFVDGNEAAIEKTRAKVPDAVFTTSAELEKVLAKFPRSGVV